MSIFVIWFINRVFSSNDYVSLLFWLQWESHPSSCCWLTEETLQTWERFRWVCAVCSNEPTLLFLQPWLSVMYNVIPVGMSEFGVGVCEVWFGWRWWFLSEIFMCHEQKHVFSLSWSQTAIRRCLSSLFSRTITCFSLNSHLTTSQALFTQTYR